MVHVQPDAGSWKFAPHISVDVSKTIISTCFLFLCNGLLTITKSLCCNIKLFFSVSLNYFDIIVHSTMAKSSYNISKHLIPDEIIFGLNMT